MLAKAANMNKISYIGITPYQKKLCPHLDFPSAANYSKHLFLITHCAIAL